MSLAEDMEIARVAAERIAAGPAEPIDDLLAEHGLPAPRTGDTPGK